MTAHTYAGTGRLSCAHGHRVEVLWTNGSPDHVLREVS
jgi:hypothetical protein